MTHDLGIPNHCIVDEITGTDLILRIHSSGDCGASDMATC